MPHADFLHVETWVFDLDNTLYSTEVRLFDQIERRMTDYVMRALGVAEAEANRLRRHYWETHGTTLAGLMREHGLDPDPYLADVHDIDLSMVLPSEALRAAIGRLPGRKVVFTNGSREHARRVTAAIGLEGAFDRLYGFEDAAYVPKPQAAAFATVFGLDGLAPARAAMFEDDPRNLAVPHSLGMRTVLVGPIGGPAHGGLDGPKDGAGHGHPHVHHATDDLVGFLARIAP